MRYNPPPNWPQPPAGWQPPPGWTPDASWGPAPAGWQVWLPDDAPPQGGAAGPAGTSAFGTGPGGYAASSPAAAPGPYDAGAGAGAPTWGGGQAPHGSGQPPYGTGGAGPYGGYGAGGYGGGPASPGSGGSGKVVAITAAAAVALLLVVGGIVLVARNGSSSTQASSSSGASLTTPARTSAPTTTSRSRTPTSSSTTTSSSPGGSGAGDTLEGAFPMITDGTETCGQVPFDPVELQAGAPVPQRAVRCAYRGSPVDGTIYLQFASSSDATTFQTRSLPAASDRTWGIGSGSNQGPEVDHTSPSGVVEQELYYTGSRYVAVARAGAGTDIEDIFQWTARSSRKTAEMPG